MHVKCDLDGLPLDFHRTGAEASDSKQFEILLTQQDEVTLRAVIADKGYDARANREAARTMAACRSSRIVRTPRTNPSSS
ncbi:MAG: transposase [Rhodopila sp.]